MRAWILEHLVDAETGKPYPEDELWPAPAAANVPLVHLDDDDGEDNISEEGDGLSDTEDWLELIENPVYSSDESDDIDTCAKNSAEDPDVIELSADDDDDDDDDDVVEIKDTEPVSGVENCSTVDVNDRFFMADNLLNAVSKVKKNYEPVANTKPSRKFLF